MLKWQLFAMSDYDIICFADADLELVPYAETSATLLARAWTRAAHALLRSEALLVADPDSQAPLNTGWMLLRPSGELFEDGIRVIERCRFNRSVGWDLTVRNTYRSPEGPPRSHSRAVAGGSPGSWLG